jgi:acetyl/propionyl-CoA carboxylase alpha subunit
MTIVTDNTIFVSTCIALFCVLAAQQPGIEPVSVTTGTLRCTLSLYNLAKSARLAKFCYITNSCSVCLPLHNTCLKQVVVDYSATLRCPMPGSVVSIAVKEGQVSI